MKIIMKMSEKEMDKIMEVCNEASIVPMDDTCFNHKVHMKYGEIIMDSDGNGYIEIDIGERAILFFMNKYSTAISLFKNIIGLIKTFCKELIDDVEAMFITDEEPEVTIDGMTMEEYIDKIMKPEVDTESEADDEEFAMIHKLFNILIENDFEIIDLDFGEDSPNHSFTVLNNDKSKKCKVHEDAYTDGIFIVFEDYEVCANNVETAVNFIIK